MRMRRGQQARVALLPMRYLVRKNRLLWGRNLRSYSVKMVGMTGFEPATP